jgi:peptidoglycan/LPS O-acetylase OafA/YrhL
VTQLSYRPDIDGLRAVAVMSVLLYHFGIVGALSGGFTGVDIFFVISGFLITSLIVADLRAGGFSLLAFYERRIRRIFPAMLVVLAVSLVAGYFFLLPGDYTSLGDSAAFSAASLANWYFLQNTGYFDRAADLLPLLHMWSLSVEEQFYLVWPPLLAAFFFIARKEAVVIPWAKRRPGAVHWPDFLFAVPLALAGARVLPPLRVRRRAYSSGGHCLGGGIDRFGIFLLALYRTARTPAPRQAVHDRGLRPCRRIDRRGCWAGCRRAARISGETVPGRPRHEQPGGNVEMGVSAAREARWTSAAIVLRVRSRLVRREDQGRALGR